MSETAVSTPSVVATGNDLPPLVWRGLILTVVSLGFYRFWYRTDLRRWYWRNTIIATQGLEYRGTARELFIGFLFALAVVLPLYFSGSLIALFAGEMLGNTVTALSGLIFAVLVQYGAYRSRRYRLTRTFWRGVRFDQKGSAWRYAGLSIVWLAVTVVTLGLMFPYLRRALERYRIKNTWFGSAQGTFDIAMWPLMKRWLLVWFSGVCVMLLSGVALGASAQLGLLGFVPGSHFADLAQLLLLILVVLLPLFLWPIYRAAEFRIFTNGTAIGHVRFVSNLGTRSYYGIFFRFAAVFLFLFLLWGAVLAALGYALSSIGLFSWAIGGLPAAFLALAGVGYLGTFLLFGGIKEIVLNQRFWRLAVQTLTLLNLGATDGIVARTVNEEPATGEGLADAFDFGGV
jgi:uncharacterized membrane protein YjgN (DUF898 family)